MYNENVILDYTPPLRRVNHTNAYEPDLPAKKEKEKHQPRVSQTLSFNRRQKSVKSQAGEGAEKGFRLTMLPNANRLRKTKEIEQVFARGKTYRGSLLLLKLTASGLADVRFCFIVSGKVSKKAVVRNKVKRRLREIAGEIIPLMAQGYDIIVVASPPAAAKDFESLRRDFAGIMAKTGLVKQPQ